MKEDGRKMSKEQQKAARQRAMKLLDSGWVQADVAQAVGMHVRTVRQWGQHRREHGMKSLLTDARGREAGGGRTLRKEQEKEIQKLIRDKLPDQLKLPFALWTRKAVAQLIEARYALRLPVRTMGEYLKRWGFTPQKPIKKAYEQQPKAVKKWLAETYPGIAAQARVEDAEIYWGDQTGVNKRAQRAARLRAQRTDPHGEPALETLWVLRDERGDQPRQRPVDGLQRSAQLRAAHQIHGTAPQAGGRAQSGSHPRQPARASQRAGQSMARRARRSDHRASPAQLPPGTQP